MKREIKFRAFWSDTLKPIDEFNDEYAINACNNDVFIVNQFTGLKDIYGKEIYEGDIVEYQYSCPHVVEYHNHGFVLQTKKNPILTVYNWNPKYLKVIGNIYEKV